MSQKEAMYEVPLSLIVIGETDKAWFTGPSHIISFGLMGVHIYSMLLRYFYIFKYFCLNWHGGGVVNL